MAEESGPDEKVGTSFSYPTPSEREFLRQLEWGELLKKAERIGSALPPLPFSWGHVDHNGDE
jgi:hypothetical protein